MNEKVDDRPKVYLAGPIQHSPDGGHGWRDRVIDGHRSLQYLNPLDFFDGSEDKATILPEDVAEDYETDTGEFLITDEELVDKDVRMVREAEALLIGFPEKVPPFGHSTRGYEWWQHNPKEGENYKVYVHRLLAVSEYGYESVKDKSVHHRNGIVWDNRPENIEVMSPEEHAKLHSPDMLKGRGIEVK